MSTTECTTAQAVFDVVLEHLGITMEQLAAAAGVDLMAPDPTDRQALALTLGDMLGEKAGTSAPLRLPR